MYLFVGWEIRVDFIKEFVLFIVLMMFVVLFVLFKVLLVEGEDMFFFIIVYEYKLVLLL